MESSVKQTPLWDRNATPTAPLRRPNSETNAGTSGSDTDIVKKSTLNVEAQEFVPRSGGVTSPPGPVPNSGSVQDRLKIYRQPHLVQQASDKDIQVVTQIVSTLTRNPGQFDDLIGVLMDTVHRYLEDIAFINNLTNLLVTQAIADANFRYSAARICQILESECPLFRSTLHVTCENQLSLTPNLHGLTLFLAELYSRINYDNLYGNCLINSICILLPKRSIEDYKCICQTLKLSGSYLDSHNRRAMDDVFTQLKAAKDQFPQSISNLIQSVITLRENQWGQGSSSSVSSSSNEGEPKNPAKAAAWRSEQPDGPIYYGPDGQELTKEESEFIQENIAEFLQDDSDPDALWDPEPEMDEEMQAAFKEFVKMSNKK